MTDYLMKYDNGTISYINQSPYWPSSPAPYNPSQYYFYASSSDDTWNVKIPNSPIGENSCPKGVEMKGLYDVYLVYGEDRATPIILRSTQAKARLG